MYDLHPHQKLSVLNFEIEQQQKQRELKRKIAESTLDETEPVEPKMNGASTLLQRSMSFLRIRRFAGELTSHS